MAHGRRRPRPRRAGDGCSHRRSSHPGWQHACEGVGQDMWVGESAMHVRVSHGAAAFPGRGRHRQHGTHGRAAYLARISLEKCAPTPRSLVLALCSSPRKIRSLDLRETAAIASTVSHGVRGQGCDGFDRVASRYTGSHIEAGAATRPVRTLLWSQRPGTDLPKPA